MRRKREPEKASTAYEPAAQIYWMNRYMRSRYGRWAYARARLRYRIEDGLGWLSQGGNRK